MSFHKRHIMSITILCSLMSITLINAVGRGRRNQGAGPSSSRSPEYYSAAESPEYHTAAESSDYYSSSSYDDYPEDSTKESTSDYIGVTNCWYHMKFYCKMINPEAIDFAKLAIANWTKGYFGVKQYMTEYYDSFSEHLNAEDILPPDEYCRQFVPDPIQPLQLVEMDDEDDNIELPLVRYGTLTPCQRALKRFGNTREDALKYGFYKIKIDEINKDHYIDSETLYNVVGLLDDFHYLREKYLRYMIDHVQLNEGYDSPLEFCKKYDEKELLRRSIWHQGRSD